MEAKLAWPGILSAYVVPTVCGHPGEFGVVLMVGGAASPERPRPLRSPSTTGCSPNLAGANQMALVLVLFSLEKVGASFLHLRVWRCADEHDGAAVALELEVEQNGGLMPSRQPGTVSAELVAFRWCLPGGQDFLYARLGWPHALRNE